MNRSRIELLATMFMSKEDKAIEIMKKLGAEYVLIFITPYQVSAQQEYYTFLGSAEEGKFIQMVRIMGKPEGYTMVRVKEAVSVNNYRQGLVGVEESDTGPFEQGDLLLIETEDFERLREQDIVTEADLIERFVNMSNGFLLPSFWDTFLGRLIPYEYATTTTIGETGRQIQLYFRNNKYPRITDGSSPLVLVYDSPHISYAEVLIYKLVDTVG
jgi:hypothetical protein